MPAAVAVTVNVYVPAGVVVVVGVVLVDVVPPPPHPPKTTVDNRHSTRQVDSGKQGIFLKFCLRPESAVAASKNVSATKGRVPIAGTCVMR